MSRMRLNLGLALLARAMLCALAIFVPLVSAQAAKETVLYRFKGGADGDVPFGSLVRDASGNLYGTTSAGGQTCNGNGAGCGTIFKVAPDGTKTTLHSFTDGTSPTGVIVDAFGNLFGTTAAGGTFGFGTIYTADEHGGYLLLNSFQGGTDGSLPQGPPVIDPLSGDLYGTTAHGGGACDCGTVFLQSYGDFYYYQKVYAFSGSEGKLPFAGLAVDAAGNFYGTTEYGGADDCGTVFKITPDFTETALHTFTCGSDGGYPAASLILDSKGNLYGEAANGGTGCGGGGGCGTIFKLTPNGTFTVLHAFTDDEGHIPWQGLIMDAHKNLYGVTDTAGAGGLGTVFKLTHKGKLIVLHAFAGGSDGNGPGSPLIMDGSGNLYGTTLYGGDDNCLEGACGTVYKIKN